MAGLKRVLSLFIKEWQKLVAGKLWLLLLVLSLSLAAADTVFIPPLASAQAKTAYQAVLPVWLILIIMAICLFLTASTVAEEKAEKKLQALLVTPLSRAEYFCAKLLFVALLGTGCLGLTLLLTGYPADYGRVLLAGLFGTLLFAAVAIAIGIAAPNPPAARTIATMVYLVFALPLLLKSPQSAGEGWRWLFPSNLFFCRLEHTMGSGALNGLLPVRVVPALETIAFILCSYCFIRRRKDI